MNWAHMHIALNHMPAMGVLFAFLLLLYAVVKRSGEMKKVSSGIFVIVAAFTIPVFLTSEAVENEMSIYVEEFKEIFHVQAPSETIPGLGYAVSSKLAKSLGEEKGISVIRDRKKGPDIIISGTVTLDTREDPKRIMIIIELKDKNGKTLRTETFSHFFEKYPASLEKDSRHISKMLRSLFEKGGN